MLTLSNTAADAIKQIVTSSQVGDAGGVRLAVRTDDQNSAKLELTVTPRPAPGDARVEEDGANVFVDPSATLLLQDKHLDANMSAEGPSFSIEDQDS